MRKFLILTVVALVAAGCSLLTPKPNPIGKNELATIEASYGVALSAAVAYRNLRLCKKDEATTVSNVCAKRDVILALQSADRKVMASLQETRAFIKNYPTLDASAYLAAARSALIVFQTIQTQNGID